MLAHSYDQSYTSSSDQRLSDKMNIFSVLICARKGFFKFFVTRRWEQFITKFWLSYKRYLLIIFCIHFRNPPKRLSQETVLNMKILTEKSKKTGHKLYNHIHKATYGMWIHTSSHSQPEVDTEEN
jgi:hypothetical protein